MSSRHVLRVLFAAALLTSVVLPGPAGAAPSPAPIKKPSPFTANSNSASAAVEFVEDLEGAKLNWSDGRLAVSGIGTPGDRGPVSYRRKLGERAAIADAYRRLAATLDLVRVDSNTRVKDLAVTDDALRAKLNDFVKSAKVLETNFWPDGTAEVVLYVPLRGDRSLTALASGNIGGAAPVTSTEPESSPTPKPAPTKEVVTAPVPIHANYTSIIVDAHGLGAQPALMPQVRDHDGKVVELGTDAAKATVKYLKDGAELDPAAGINPLNLRAVRTQGALKADLVLNPEGSDAIKNALKDKKLAPGAAILVRL
ncbi:MAG: hypothetical protein JWM80_6544 [Cyanobacteria bacterium RYN_339]|nr:hypothetical protein [Cyanobacteria bacterium RYN_339]